MSKGISKKTQSATGFLTPEAAARRALEEAQNVDLTGHRRVAGDRIRDRDGRAWYVAAVGRDHYTAVPVSSPAYGDIGYVFRMLTDKQIDERDFGFNRGFRLVMKDGTLTEVMSDFT